MKPIPVETPRFRQNRAIMMLDDAELTLDLIDLDQTTTLRDGRGPSTEPVLSSDFLAELYSAASMIMDREECDALVREIELARQHHPVAA